MNIWSSVKRRLQMKRAKAVRQKATAAGELVVAGTALTGGVMLLEEVAKPSEPQLAGHDNVYATDNGQLYSNTNLWRTKTTGLQPLKS